MPRNVGNLVSNNFSKGLVTEASPINFPQNACAETDNCVFHQMGTVYRREGIDLESSAEYVTPDNHEQAINEYLWRAVAQSGTVTFVVQQLGSDIHFYRFQQGEALSAGRQSFSIDMNDYLAGSSPVASAPVDFASGHGKLFITHPNCEPVYVVYYEDTNSIGVTPIDIQIRDFDGVADGLAIDDNPTTLTTDHKYNLYNQGWYEDVYAVPPGGTGQPSLQSPITRWFTDVGNYPSNAQTWWAYLRPTGNSNFREGMDTNMRHQMTRNNSPAPRGHYVYTAFNINRTAVSGITGLTTETSGSARPACTGFFAGRVFYAGTKSRKYSSKIYFTQIIERDEQIGYCYQERDPTDKEAPDLLPSDGGVINIPEVAEVVKLVPKGSTLMVFATNGVWQISGSEGVGFKANDYSVTKVSDTPALSQTSFVIVDGNPVWCNKDGIWTVAPNQTGTAFQVQSLTDSTIKTFYQAIPDSRKERIKGAFNSKTRLITWLFGDIEDEETLPPNSFNRVLVFNPLSGAFYPWSVDYEEAQLKGVFTSDGTSYLSETENVTVSGVAVTVSGSPITVTTTTEDTVATETVFVVYVPNSGITFATERDENFVDWATVSDGVGYSSYFVAGYSVLGEINKDFQSNYVTVNYAPITDGSAFVQGLWEWASAGSTGRWSTQQQIYRLNETDYAARNAKLKVRGSGKALQIKVRSEAEKPFKINGWAVLITGNQIV